MKIIDVSADNGIIDWGKVAADGITDVFIRVSLGVGTLDKRAMINAQRAAANGILVSYYHVAYADSKSGDTVVADATNEAEYFTACIRNPHMPPPKWIAVDLETETKLSREDYTLWLTTFLEHVQVLLGLEPIIYTYKSYFDTHVVKGHGFGKYRLWIANYNNVPKPELPDGWDSYYLWQFTEHGAVPGMAQADEEKINDNLI